MGVGWGRELEAHYILYIEDGARFSCFTALFRLDLEQYPFTARLTEGIFQIHLYFVGAPVAQYM